MPRERRAGGVAQAGDDVDDAVGDARLLGQLAEIKGRERSVFGRLDDDGVARGEGRGNAPADGEERKIPREDEAADAVRRTNRAGIEAGDGDGFAPARVHGEIGVVTQG